MKKNLMAISLMTISCLYGLLAAMIILVFAVTDLPIIYGIIISIIFIIIQFLIAPALNDWVFKHFYKMKKDYKLPEYLENFIAESCEKHQMAYPKIGFIDDGSPNAFTYGRTKNDARVVITRGILDLLTEEEVKAVVAHELGHANHYDMLFMTVAQIVPLILYYVFEIMRKADSRRSSNKNNGNATAVIGLVAYVLYIVSQYIILWLSRTREYYADSFAIEETRNPSALGNALVKIGFGLAMGTKNEDCKMTKGANALGINNAKVSKGMAIGAYNNGGVSKENVVNAMKWERWNIWAKWIELNSTHPLISNRLLAIADRCEEFGQEPYIVFNETKPESYVDDFLLEIFLASLPVLITIAWLIVVFADVYYTTYDHFLCATGIGGMLITLSLFLLLHRTHKNKNYKETNVAELLSEVKVSNITSIPCILEGTIIGRGNPGCIFNEDFVLQDETGIIFLDYNQPLYIMDKIFALFRSPEYFNKRIRIKGWYRRGAVPYVELYSMEIDGKTKKCHTYTFTKVVYCIFMLISIYCLTKAFL